MTPPSTAATSIASAQDERGVERGRFEAAYVDLLVAIADWMARDDLVVDSAGVGSAVFVPGSVVIPP